MPGFPGRAVFFLPMNDGCQRDRSNLTVRNSCILNAIFVLNRIGLYQNHWQAPVRDCRLNILFLPLFSGRIILSASLKAQSFLTTERRKFKISLIQLELKCILRLPHSLWHYPQNSPGGLTCVRAARYLRLDLGTRMSDEQLGIHAPRPCAAACASRSRETGTLCAARATLSSSPQGSSPCWGGKRHAAALSALPRARCNRARQARYTPPPPQPPLGEGSAARPHHVRAACASRSRETGTLRVFYSNRAAQPAR